MISEEQISPAPMVDNTFLKKHGTKLISLTFWLIILGSYWWYTRANDLTLGDSVRQIADLLTGTFLGPIIYIILYTIRPLIFFPATIITLLSGFLFGPIGIIYTIVGSNASAMVAYTVGRFFGQGVLESDEEAGFIQRYTQRMRQNSFETVLLLRLLFLPYDLVNYAAGFLRIDWKAFIVATAVGSVPGTISFVLLGGSFGTLDELLSGKISPDPVSLAVSIVIIIASIALSRYLKKRETTSG